MTRFSPRSDMPERGWMALVPRPLRPYLQLMRLDRPIGIWLLLLPGWWSITLASLGTPDVQLLGLFLAGAVVMRGAGCTFNDIVDRDIDAKVARTASRPLPSGRVPVAGAAVFLVLQLAAGLVILVQFNRVAIEIGAASLLLVFTYPFMKRITWWPQAWLGLTFNWGALLGCAAVRGTLDRPSFLLYAAGFFWTLGYDTIYALQDREDDALTGVKSSAIALGGHPKPALAAFAAATVALIATAILPPLYSRSAIALLALAALHLVWQIATLRPDDPDNCLTRFRANRDFGVLVLVAIWLAWR
jgi:4-hydroxybenzoate polyprenyltransferase